MFLECGVLCYLSVLYFEINSVKMPKTKHIYVRLVLLSALMACGLCPVFGAGWKTLPGHVPAAVRKLIPIGRLSATNRMNLAIGLPLRNEVELDALIRELYNPASPNYRHYLTPEEFTARFGPTEADYQAVKEFARTNGLTITGIHPNRVVLDVAGLTPVIERTFHVTLRTYRHPHESRGFFAPDKDPAADFPMALMRVSGLDNYSLPQPRIIIMPQSAQVSPKNGSGSGGAYIGKDFRNAYVPGTTLTGAGQSVALLQFDGYVSNDIVAYANAAGLAMVPLTNVMINGGNPSPKPGIGNTEVCMDIEMVMSMSPGISRIIVYEGVNGTTSWSTILSRIANDNLARQVSCSWGGGSTDGTEEGIFKQMILQGQSFFNAAGDSDAFVGSIPFPSESTNITQVGGTTLTMNGNGTSYASETVWNFNNSGHPGEGSSGGISTSVGIPYWQQGISMTANKGSLTMRNVPDEIGRAHV